MTNLQIIGKRFDATVVYKQWSVKLALAEWIATITASIIAVYLHIVRIQHAGGLWRDEVATLNAATASTLSDLWEKLGYEIMPGLSLLAIRLWSLSGFGVTDFELRVFGFLVGLCIIGAMWANGTLCGYRIPFVSLGLLGFSPLLISTGDSIRPYGLAIVLILLTAGTTLKALQSSHLKWIAVTAVLSILSVQCAYGNACLVCGACAGAAAVSACRRDWKRLALFCAVGASATLSLALYLEPLSRISEWVIVVQGSISVWHLIGQLIQAMGSPEPFMCFVWLGFVCLAACLIPQHSKQKSGNASPRETDAVLFAGAAVPASAAAYFFWLTVSKYTTYPWHYLSLLAVTALYFDIIFSYFVKKQTVRIFRLAMFAGVVALCVPPAWQHVQVRHTNIDMVACFIAERAEPKDLIVLNPWFLGISFQRYYTGSSAITAVPPIGIVSSSRYDLLKRKMTSENPLDPLFNQIEDTLRNSRQVWIVGGAQFLKEDQYPLQLPPAPCAGIWSNEIYAELWTFQTTYFLQTNAVEVEIITRDGFERVSPYENIPILLFRGWRGEK